MLRRDRYVLYMIIAMLFALLGMACSDAVDTSAAESEEITNYISTQSLDYTETNSGLFYSIIDTGDTDRPVLTDTVIIDYSMYLLNGQEVESALATVQLSYLIDGLSEGLRLIGRGGQISLLIPSDLAFEDRGDGDILPNSPLRVEVRLEEFYEDLFEYHSRLIEQYVDSQPLDTIFIIDEVYYAIQDTGITPFLTDSSIVTLTYRGYLLDGSTFDDTYEDQPGLTIDMTDAISGWRLAMPLFGVGGKGRLFIPSPLAYGSEGIDGVSPDTPVAFDFEILSVE